MYYVVYSQPTYTNPLTVLSAHYALQSALQAAKAAALDFAVAANVASCKAANPQTLAHTLYAVTQHSADMLDAHCVATFAVEDDCWIVTQSVDALFAPRAQ